MNRSLFPVQYDDGFEQCWRLYRSRCESPNCMRKDEAAAVWIKTRNLRPELPIMLGCIKLYLDQVERAKRVQRSGRDEKVTYFKLHFSTFLGHRKNGWQDFVEQAEASLALTQTAPQMAQEAPTRRSFKASDLPDPIRTSPLKPIAQILAEARARKNNSRGPLDTP